ncbi:60S acidic ribosomal protein P0-like [Asparagus officinalis]|uniref:60S acidic ribosomal protein P0-like n=1 Tax=Asparagus officinalis TaxID=4686 RepID=UPI00098E611B|nr:60S acidic ribosomal protein P0-like [Asparagus officinalis]
MAINVTKVEKKLAYDKKLCSLLDEYRQVLIVVADNTELDQSEISSFQIFNIPTKSNKDSVEIITPIELIKKGDKVSSSEVALLAKLGINLFSYGFVALSVYDNTSVFGPEVLNLTDDDLVDKFVAGVYMVTLLPLAFSYLTFAAVPHVLINAYKNILASPVDTEYTFPQAERVMEYLKDPSKFAVAITPVAATENTAAPDSKEDSKQDFKQSCNIHTLMWVLFS